MIQDKPSSLRAGGPVQKRSRQKVADILNAARRVMARQGGIGLTITDIAAESGIMPGSIYRYFADRSAILRVLGQETSRQMVNILHDAIASGREAKLGQAEILALAVERLYEAWRSDPVSREIWLSILAEQSLQDIVPQDAERKLALVQDLLGPLPANIAGKDDVMGQKLLLEFLHCATRVALDFPALKGRQVIDRAKAILSSMLVDVKSIS